MVKRLEVRVDVRPDSDLDVYFWQNGQRFDAILFDGGADEIKFDDTAVTETISAWAELLIRETKRTDNGQPGWQVSYQSNVKTDEIHVVLNGIKKRIEDAIQTGVSTRIDITADLMMPGWEYTAIVIRL